MSSPRRGRDGRLIYIWRGGAARDGDGRRPPVREEAGGCGFLSVTGEVGPRAGLVWFGCGWMGSGWMNGTVWVGGLVRRRVVTSPGVTVTERATCAGSTKYLDTLDWVVWVVLALAALPVSGLNVSCGWLKRKTPGLAYFCLILQKKKCLPFYLSTI